MLWIELASVITLAIASAVIARALGKQEYWWAAFGISLALISLVIVARRSVPLSFEPPFSWAIAPHVSPPLMALAIPTMLGVLITRLPERRKKIMVHVLTTAMIAYFAILPLALPLAVRGSLLSATTVIDAHGICRQQHTYSCGPAAAVTCLRRLGIDGEESAIAIAAQTAPALGTDGSLLAAAVTRLYGVACSHRYENQLDHVHLPAVAAIYSPRYGGHYIALLSVEPDAVIVGDPLNGKERWSRTEFLQQWRGEVVEFQR